MSETFDHARVSNLLKIIHDTVNVPGMDAIRDAAAKELAAISGPLREAAAKEAAETKEKIEKAVAEANARHRKFVPPVAAHLNDLAKTVITTTVDHERLKTPDTLIAKDTAEKAYKDAVAAAEADPTTHRKEEPPVARAIPSSGPTGPVMGPTGATGSTGATDPDMSSMKRV